MLRLFAWQVSLAMATGRLGLIAHELVGHGGTAVACGGEITEVRLFWFAGGWIRYQFDEPSTGVVVAVSLGGIVLEALIGLGMYAGLARRADGVGVRFLRGIGAVLVIHACWYFATGTWHGYGDGIPTYRLLGAWRVPLSIGVGALGVLAAFAAARITFGAMLAELPGSRRAKIAGVVVSSIVAAGVIGGLAIGEVKVRGDVRYGAIMQTEGSRETARELARWRTQQAARHLEVSEAELEAERARIAALHDEPPFRIPLAIALALAVIAGAIKARPAPPARVGRRQLAVAGAIAVGSIAAVIAIDLAC